MSTSLGIHHAKSIELAANRDHGSFFCMSLIVTTENGSLTYLDFYSAKPLVIEGASFDEFVKCHTLETAHERRY